MRLFTALLVFSLLLLHSIEAQAQSENQKKLIELAKTQYENGDYAQTLNTLTKAINVNGKQETNAEIILWQAKSYVQLGQMEMADKVMSTFYMYSVSEAQEEEMNKLIEEMVNGTDKPTGNREKESQEDVFIIVDQKPEFKGGSQQMAYFIQQNLKYPPQAVRENVEGRVFVSFVVTKTGEVTRVKIEKGIGSGCDEEAMRLVKSFPNFIPGSIKGQPVNVKLTLPISFRLQ